MHDVSTPTPDLTDRFVQLGIRQVGDEILTRPAEPVIFGQDDVLGIVARLRDTLAQVLKLYNFRNGLGLAAPQIGLGKRVCIFGDSTDNLFVFVNPLITEFSSDYTEAYEGCLSCWSQRGITVRASSISMTGYCEHGRPQTRAFGGVLARLAQHEYDHLCGILYFDRMLVDSSTISLEEYSRVKSALAKKRL